MIVKTVCPTCQRSIRVEATTLPLGMREATRLGWAYRDNVPLGKSTVTMFCPAHHPEELRLDADYVPAEVVPGTA